MTEPLEPVEPDQAGGNSGEPPVRRGQERERNLAQIIFLGPNGVRAGWRAALYVAIFIVIEFVLQSLVALDPFASMADLLNTPEMLLVREIVLIVGALGAAQVMALIERRKVGTYGVPWRGAFPRASGKELCGAFCNSAP